MKRVQILLEASLFRAADRAVRRLKVNRSALIRRALREHLTRLRSGEREDRDREGYERHPDVLDEPAVWDNVAAWPED
jgi:metal-responsive CopG/Arc/MetJ family transcriptional regulator